MAFRAAPDEAEAAGRPLAPSEVRVRGLSDPSPPAGAARADWSRRLARFWPRRVAAAEPLAAALADHFATGRARRVGAQRADGVAFEIETEEYFTLAGRLAALDDLALAACRGRVLDVGAGAGRHALALEARGHAVQAIDVSPICVDLCRARGVSRADVFDVMQLDGDAPFGRFDTLFFGMQTIGVAGGVETLGRLLERLRGCLAPGGRIVADSSALREAWVEDGADEDGAHPGEIVLETRYRGWRGEPFPWLYVDDATLSRVATGAGYRCEVVGRVEDGEYLALLHRKAATAEEAY